MGGGEGCVRCGERRSRRCLAAVAVRSLDRLLLHPIARNPFIDLGLELSKVNDSSTRSGDLGCYESVDGRLAIVGRVEEGESGAAKGKDLGVVVGSEGGDLEDDGRGGEGLEAGEELDEGGGREDEEGGESCSGEGGAGEDR